MNASLGGLQTVRAALFNIISYIPQRSLETPLHHIISNIIQRLPCRAISIYPEREGRELLSIEVHPHVLEKRAARITYDEVVVKSSLSHLSCVPSALMPYLLSDLPIYLMWDESPESELVVLPQLQRFASRLIFSPPQSGSFPCISTALRDYLETAPLEIVDLQWLMTRVWRDAIARLFHAEESLELLRYSYMIDITYHGSKADAIQGIYLGFWFAAQFGWHVRRIESTLVEIALYFVHDKGEVVVHLVNDGKDSAERGALLSVGMLARDRSLWSIERHPYGNIANVSVTRVEQEARSFSIPLAHIQRGASYIRELFQYSSGDHYHKMLALLYSATAQASGPS